MKDGPGARSENACKEDQADDSLFDEQPNRDVMGADSRPCTDVSNVRINCRSVRTGSGT
jgi:hypothetical protein